MILVLLEIQGQMSVWKGRWITDNSAQRRRPRTTRPIKKSAQDNLAEVVPISEDNLAQIAPILEDLLAHENQTKHLLMYSK